MYEPVHQNYVSVVLQAQNVQDVAVREYLNDVTAFNINNFCSMIQEAQHIVQGNEERRTEVQVDDYTVV